MNGPGVVNQKGTRRRALERTSRVVVLVFETAMKPPISATDVEEDSEGSEWRGLAGEIWNVTCEEFSGKIRTESGGFLFVTWKEDGEEVLYSQ